MCKEECACVDPLFENKTKQVEHGRAKKKKSMAMQIEFSIFQIVFKKIGKHGRPCIEACLSSYIGVVFYGESKSVAAVSSPNLVLGVP